MVGKHAFWRLERVSVWQGLKFCSCNRMPGVMVNFMCNLTGWTNAHMADKKLRFWLLFVKVILEEISIWLNKLHKENLPSPNAGGQHPIPSEPK